jgi:hypothetical protein
MTLQERIRKALDRAGYHELEPTENNLKECFLDYVAGGYYGNLTLEEALEEIEDGDITVNEMINNLR